MLNSYIVKNKLIKIYRDENYREYIFIYFLRGMSVLFLFFLNIFLSNIFGPQAFGIYAVIASFILIASVFCRYGTDALAFRYIPIFLQQKNISGFLDFHAYSLKVVLVTFLIILFLIIPYIYYEYISGGNFISYVIAIIIIPLFSLLYNYSSFLIAMKRLLSSQILFGMARPMLIMIICFIFYLFIENPSAEFIVLSDLLATLIICTAAYLVFKSNFPEHIRRPKIKFKNREFLKEGFSMTAISAAQLILSKSDVIIVGIIMGPKVAGLYFAASQISGIVTFFIQSANQVIAPNISRLYYNKDNKKLQEYITKTAIFLCIITIPVIFVIIYFGNILLLLYGSDFTNMYDQLVVLSASNFIIVFFGPVGFLLSMTGGHKAASGISMLSAILNIILNAILVPVYGTMGAATAMLLSVGFRSVAMSLVVWRILGIISIPFPPFILVFLRRFRESDCVD